MVKHFSLPELHGVTAFLYFVVVMVDNTGLKKQEGKKKNAFSGWQEWMKGKKSCLPSALLQPVPRSIVLHRRENKNERERARRAEFHTVQLLHSGSHHSVWKEDHQDDTEFIPHNSSVISVIEYISFTVTGRINFRLDSNPANAYFTHLTFHLRLNIHSLAFN